MNLCFVELKMKDYFKSAWMFCKQIWLIKVESQGDSTRILAVTQTKLNRETNCADGYSLPFQMPVENMKFCQSRADNVPGEIGSNFILSQCVWDLISDVPSLETILLNSLLLLYFHCYSIWTVTFRILLVFTRKFV